MCLLGKGRRQKLVRCAARNHAQAPSAPGLQQQACCEAPRPSCSSTVWAACPQYAQVGWITGPSTRWQCAQASPGGGLQIWQPGKHPAQLYVVLVSRLGKVEACLHGAVGGGGVGGGGGTLSLGLRDTVDEACQIGGPSQHGCCKTLYQPASRL